MQPNSAGDGGVRTGEAGQAPYNPVNGQPMNPNDPGKPSGGGPYVPFTNTPVGTTGTAPAASPVPTFAGAAGDPTAAHNLAYARAKDTIAQQTRGALMALKDEATSGGQFVAGGQNPALQAAESNLIARGGTNLANFSSRQASAEAASADEAAKMQYAAELAAWQKSQLPPGALTDTDKSMLGLLGPEIVGMNPNSPTNALDQLRRLLGPGRLY